MSWDKIPNHIRLKTLDFLYEKKNSILFNSDLYLGLSEAIEELELWCFCENKDIYSDGPSDLISENELENLFDKLGIS